MFRYVFSFLLAALMIGCGDDGDGVADEEMSQGAQQQTAPDSMVPGAPATDLDLNEEEMRDFIDASVNAHQVQQESQQEMVGIVDEEGIDVETYNEIMQAQQGGQSNGDVDMNPEDLERFEAAWTRIQEVEEGMEELFVEAVEDAGMNMDRFMEINMAVQQDPELQQQLQRMMQEEQEQGMQGQSPSRPQEAY